MLTNFFFHEEKYLKEFWDESDYIKTSMMTQFCLLARGQSVIVKVSRLIICRNQLKLNAMLIVTARGQQIHKCSFVTFG